MSDPCGASSGGCDVSQDETHRSPYVSLRSLIEPRGNAMIVSRIEMPTSLTIDNPVVVVENVLSFVVCRANNGMPEAKLSWHLPKSISYLSKNDYALLSDQSLRNSISNLTFVPSRSFHGQLIRCQAHSAALDINNQSLITEQYIHTICSSSSPLFSESIGSV